MLTYTHAAFADRGLHTCNEHLLALQTATHRGHTYMSTHAVDVKAQNKVRWPYPLKMHGNAATVSKNGLQDKLPIGALRRANR